MKNITLYSFLIFCGIMLLACYQLPEQKVPQLNVPYLIVLGIAQDAGYPQAGCQKDCCRQLWEDKSQREMVSCLGLVDPVSHECWLFDATPDFKDQLQLLRQELSQESRENFNGIFLTHAHIGHYTGLMHLGREAMGARQIPVYTMPRMKTFLQKNGPWSQLVSLENIQLREIRADSVIRLNERLQVQPFLVPHRDEFSETAGYKILGPQASAIFIPDIDKWEKWETDIREKLAEVDFAFLDGTFFENGEIPGRDMALIPHPFIQESRQLFSTLPLAEKNKIFFIHFNHTNPVLREGVERKSLQAEGFGIAREGERFPL